MVALGPLAAIAALLAVPIVAARGHQQAPPATGATNERFASLGSNRYGYWRVAIDTGLGHPLAGVGASGFRQVWLARRDVDEVVHDAHSLEFETFAELGLVGVALLAALLGAVALSGRALARADPLLAAGPLAALTVWTFHSAIDWDWEIPALTLVAVVLAGAVLGRAGEPGPQVGQQVALGVQDQGGEDAEDERGLGDGLDGRPLPAPARGVARAPPRCPPPAAAPRRRSACASARQAAARARSARHTSASSTAAMRPATKPSVPHSARPGTASARKPTAATVTSIAGGRVWSAGR